MPKTDIFALLISLLLTTAAVGQQNGIRPAQTASTFLSNPQSEACDVTGVVVSRISGEVISHARIKVNSVSRTNQVPFIADANGRFLLQRVPAGPQTVTVQKKGYLDASFDIVACEHSRNSRTNRLQETSAFVTLRLLPLSAVSGRVTDEAGDPVVEAEVHAKQAGPGSHLRTVANAITDDLGMYRLHGLQPGAYYISAGPPESTSAGAEGNSDGAMDDYDITYYPQGSQITAAMPVPVRPGDSPSGVDIQLAKTSSQNRTVVPPISRSDISLSSTERGVSGAANAAPATMSGTIVNDVTNEPVKGAKITLEPTRNGGASYGSQADVDGHFTIPNINAGNYRAVVEKPGFLSIPHSNGALRQLPMSLTLKPKQILKDVVFRVTPWSVLSGKVFDEDGNSAQDFQVEALRYSYVNGKRALQVVATSVTNDLGEYRIYGLSRGKYYVSAGAQVPSSEDYTATREHYVATYYPQALDLQNAAPIAVEDGVQVAGINVWARVSKLVDVRGRILSDSGSISKDAVVALTRNGTDASEISFNATGGINAQGNFHFSAVPPGSYTLSALSNDTEGQYAAEQTVQVADTNVDNIDLQLNKAISIGGRVQVDGGPMIAFKSVRVLLEAENRSPAGSVVGDVHPDGTFSVSGLLPQQYTVEVFGLPDEYYLKAITSGTEEAQDQRIDFRRATGPLRLIVAAGVSVSGSVSDQDQQLAPGIDVVLISTSQGDDAPKVSRTTVTDYEGKFRFVGLAPGTYNVFAIEGVEQSAYSDPDFLTSVEEYAQSVTLRDSSSTNLNIEAISSGRQ